MGFARSSRYESEQKNELEIVQIFRETVGSFCSLLTRKMDHKMFSPCILLIHNDVKLLVKLEAALEQAGYRVLTAYDGCQGIHLAQAALPEVIVCDVKMPSRNDFEVQRTLAQDSRTASIPVISMPRPFDRQELVARVNALIRSHAIH